MPIHHKHKILFIHIPKTGGSSIEEFFGMTETENLCYGNEIGKIGGVMFALQHLTASLLQQLDFMSMHFDIYFKFAFVRNPYERVLSEYFGQDANRARVDFDLGLFKIWFDETHSIIDTDHKLPQYDFVYDSLSQIPNVDVDAGTLHLFANFYDGTTYPPNPDTGQNFLLLSAFNTSGANVQEEIVDLIDVGDIIRIQNGDGSKVQSFTADTATAFGDERIMVPFNTATFSYVSISGTGFSHNEDVTFINTSATVFIDKELESVMRYTLYPNYPNPFNPVTTLRYDIPGNAFVNIRIYDLKGRLVNTLVSKGQTAGYKAIKWAGVDNKGKAVSAGLYLYTIEAGEFIQTKKMVLLK